MFASISDRVRRNLLIAITIISVIAVGIPFLTRKQSEWDEVYRPAARRLLAGENLYPQGTNYAYPPLTALLVAPLAHADDRLARAIWFMINLGFIAVLLVSAWRMIKVGRVIREAGVFWLGMAVGFPFIIHAMSHQQIDAVVTAVVILGCYSLTVGRPIRAAVAFGLAAAVKCTPLLFAPYLVVKRQYRAAGVVVSVAVGANLLPDLVSRPSEHSCQLFHWSEAYLAPMFKSDYAPGMWASHIIYNQSAVGAANRWTHSTWSSGEKITIESVPAAVTAGQLKFVAVGLVGLLAGLGLYAARRGRWRPDVVTWECGLVLTTMLLISPMSSVPHFATLLLPAWLVAREVIIGRRWELFPALGLMAFGAIFSNKDLVGSRLYTLGLWYGSVMWGGVGGFLGCVVGLLGRTVIAMPDVLRFPDRTESTDRRAA